MHHPRRVVRRIQPRRLFLVHFSRYTRLLAWPILWIFLLSGIPILRADPPPLEYRVDPARAAHGFGAWVNSSPTSNGTSDGIHYDQNNKPYLRHLPSLDP